MQLPNLVQITNEEYDERFYLNRELGIYRPSVTYILSKGFPTNRFLHEWIGNKGWEEAERIKEQRGQQGSKIHHLIDLMQDGVIIPSEGLSFWDKRCLRGFQNFWQQFRPVIIAKEFQIESKLHNYAGTVDLLAKLNIDDYKDEWVIDFKTSKNLQDTHLLQVAAYEQALKESDGKKRRTLLVSLGNETQASFLKKECTNCTNSTDHCFNAFKAAHEIFRWLNPNAKPRTESFPHTFSIPLCSIPSPTSRTKTKSQQKVAPTSLSQ